LQPPSPPFCCSTCWASSAPCSASTPPPSSPSAPAYRIFYNAISALLDKRISADLAICIAVVAASSPANISPPPRPCSSC